MSTRTVLRLALLAALISGGLTAVTAAPAHAAACYTSTSGDATWYPGPSASYRYDARFGNGPVAVPQAVLDAYVPQGLATWSNWDGSGTSLLVYSAYAEDDGPALVQGVDPATGARTRAAYVPASHVGGIAFSNGYAWIAGGGKISRYSLGALRGAFKGTSAASIRPGYTRDAYGTSFLGAQGGLLYAGRFNETARDAMHRYRIETTGALTLLSGSVAVPVKTQGVAISPTHYFFSTSYGETSRSTIYVVRRGYGLDSAKAACFRAPTMSEGATIHNGRLYVVFESGAHKYVTGADPSNVVKRLHQAALGNLTTLVD